MKKLLLNIILVGFFLGALSAVFTMFLGITIFYALKAMEIYLAAEFLELIGISAVVIGLCIALAFYIYLLFTARAYFFALVDRFFDGDKK